MPSHEMAKDYKKIWCPWWFCQLCKDCNLFVSFNISLTHKKLLHLRNFKMSTHTHKEREKTVRQRETKAKRKNETSLAVID